jgi:Uma2 family endonuclease
MAAALSVPGPLTRADLDRFPDDGRRYELIDGALLVSPMARPRHQRVVMRLATELELWSRVNGGATYPGVNVDLDDRTHLEPDVAWAPDEYSGDGWSIDPPTLVVEVSSPSTRAFDRGIKRATYLAAGVVELWLVDLERDVIERHTADRAEPVVHSRGEDVTTPLLPGFRVAVDAVLGASSA